MLAAVSGASGQPAQRLADLNPTASDSSSLLPLPRMEAQFATAGGLGFFVANDGVTGRELWVTDGSNTRLVREVRTGYTDQGNSFDPQIDQLTPLGDGILFVARTRFTGSDWVEQLWTSDGTAAGTIPVSHPGKDLSLANGVSILGTRNAGAFPRPQAFVAAVRPGGFGSDLWITDGRPEGTRRLFESLRREDGVERSSEGSGAMLGFKLVYAGSTQEDGIEVWISDGTTGGTRLLRDIRPGTEAGPFGADVGRSSQPWGFVRAGTRVYFLAETEVNGRELWSTDGTAGGTRLVHDFTPGEAAPGIPRSSNLSLRNAIEMDGRLLFQAPYTLNRDGQPVEVRGLWLAQAGGQGVELYAPEFVLSAPPVIAGGKVWLLGFNGVFSGLFAADTGGPRPIIEAGAPMVGAGNTVFALNQHGNLLVVDAVTALPTAGIPVTDPETGQAHELNQLVPLGKDGSSPGPLSFATFGGRLFFSADLGLVGREPWLSDGTPPGTRPLRDVNRVNRGRIHSTLTDPAFIAAGGSAFFLSDVDSPGFSYWLWEVGPAPGVPSVVTKDGLPAAFHPATAGSPPWGAEFSGSFVATAGDLDENRRLQNLEPHRVAGDPTDSRFKAALLHDLHPEAAPDGSEPNLSSTPSGYLKAGAFLYFSTHQGELWRTDGTANGAVKLLESDPTAIPFALTDFNGSLLFCLEARDPGSFLPVTQLWKSDGSAAGTKLIAAFSGSAHPTMQVLGNRVIFTVGDNFHATDGTTAGTATLVLPAEVGSAVNIPLRGFPVFQGRLWFSARSPDNSAAAIWSTDGTTEGTKRIRVLNQAANLWQVVSNRLWFTSQQNVPNPDPVGFPRYLDSMCELWRTDGTPGGTELVAWDPFEPGVEQQVKGLTAVVHTLYYAKSDAVHGRELWRSDGTAGGTVLVQDLFPGPNSGLGDNAMVNGLQALNLADRLVFAAEDPTGVNPWALAHASRQVAAPVIKPVPAEVVTYLQRPFALALFLESGGPATWTAHGLPPGIESNPVTGELTGRATYPGAYAVTLDAANSGATGVARFTLRVLAPPELDFSFDESGISLVARGEPGQRYAIQVSSDFISWETFLPEVQAGDNTRVSFAQMNARGIGCFRLVVK